MLDTQDKNEKQAFQASPQQEAMHDLYLGMMGYPYNVQTTAQKRR